MDDEVTTAKLHSTWEAAAPGWARWEPVFSNGLAERTNTMLDAAGVQTGSNVLDIACGAGSQTLEAARRVGPDGHILATDISSTMLGHVRRMAAEAGLVNIDTAESAAEHLDVPAESFDAAICRLGLMLFAAPAHALAAVRVALKPGCRFAALVFTTPSNNGFFARPMQILQRHAHAMPHPGGPGLFALGGDGVLESLLVDCGLNDVRVSTVHATIHFDSSDDALQMFQEAGGAYRAMVAELSDEARAQAWADVGESLSQLERANGVEAELELAIGSGAKPS